MGNALLIVDVQPTFCEGGELPIDGGNACAQRIAQYADEHTDDYDLIVTTQDWHIEPGGHFSTEPDFVDTWPPHGVAGSPNAEVHSALADLHVDYAVKKGQYRAAYSGFEGETPDGTTLTEVLRSEGIDQADVVGLALSHCVKETALDARRLGLRVRVLEDLSEPVSRELGEAAVAQLREAGVCVTRSGK
ncbi:isochorismatase family protein [Scrofimicrobium sp. R131]|uniref:nicotinamidase n=1 Tax=Scrofimicrobium appendicitidis TaxID=3079930 RepID=A0AAU7V653_9ACTO